MESWQQDKQSKSPSTRRYSPAEKRAGGPAGAPAPKELGTDQGTVGRVARQLGYGVESVRSWVKQADIDEGVTPGDDHGRGRADPALEQENRELKRSNEILRRASAYFAQAELDRPWK